MEGAAKVSGEFGSDLSQDQFLCILHFFRANWIFSGKKFLLYFGCVLIEFNICEKSDGKVNRRAKMES